MARYDREFLVPYLEDICALQLSKKKIVGMIASSHKEIKKINDSALKNVGEPDLEAYKEPGDATVGEIGTGCFGMVCLISSLITFFVGIVEPPFLVLAAVLFVLGISTTNNFMSAEDTANEKIKERNDEKERDHAVKQMAALVVAEPQVNAVKDRIRFLEGEIRRIDQLLERAYSINILPRWYRDLYSAVYLYDWFSNSRADDLDMALNTLVLEQIKDRLDTIIRNQGEQIINQRIMIANQHKAMEQADCHHAALMARLDRIEATNEDRNMYLSMIEANTAANAYFTAANYLK